MSADRMDGHIDLSLGTRGNQPRIRGRGISVKDVASRHHCGVSAEAIAADYALSRSDVHAALAYYFDHPADIDQSVGDYLGLRVDYEYSGEQPSICRIMEPTNHITNMIWDPGPEPRGGRKGS